MNSNFEHSVFQDTSFSGIYNNVLTSFVRSNLSFSNFFNANFGVSSFQECNFSNANLEKANINETILAGSNFLNANLKNATLCRTHVDNVFFSQSIYLPKWISIALNEKSKFSKIMLMSKIKDGFKNLVCSDLSLLDLSEIDLKNANMEYASIEGTMLTKTNLSGVKWVNSKICKNGSIGYCIQ